MESLNYDDFPMLMSGESHGFTQKDFDKMQPIRDKMVRLIDKLNAAVAVGFILNPDYNDLKFGLDRAIDNAWETHISKPFFWGKGYQPDIDDICHSPSLAKVNSCKKKVAKCKVQDHPACIAVKKFLDEVTPLAEAMEGLKSKIVKRPPAGQKIDKATGQIVPSKPVFQPPLARMADVKRVTDLLTQITQEVADQLKESIKRTYLHIAKTFMDEYQAGRVIRDNRPSMDPIRDFYLKIPPYIEITRNLMKQESQGAWNKPPIITWRPDSDAVADKMAQEQAKAMQDAFVSKNTSKLAPIVSAKPGLADAEIVHVSANRSIEGTMRLSFTDGSHFRVKNTVVLSYSIRQTPFYRFPTTFHDVVMADGSRMKLPSEEKMHKEFAGIDTPVEKDEE